MKIETLNAIINAFEVASKDVTRYALTFVRIMPKDQNSIQIDACDGHKLSRVVLPDTDLSQLLSGEYFVSREALPGLKAAAKAFKNVGQVSAKAADDCLLVETGAGQVRIENARKANIQFPNLEQVIPKLRGDEIAVSFNAEYLMDLLKSLRDTKRCEMVTLVIKNPSDAGYQNSPIVVEVQDQSGVLMPMRGPRQQKKGDV